MCEAILISSKMGRAWKWDICQTWCSSDYLPAPALLLLRFGVSCPVACKASYSHPLIHTHTARKEASFCYTYLWNFPSRILGHWKPLVSKFLSSCSFLSEIPSSRKDFSLLSPQILFFSSSSSLKICFKCLCRFIHRESYLRISYLCSGVCLYPYTKRTLIKFQLCYIKKCILS